jgi:hypothetical protein
MLPGFAFLKDHARNRALLIAVAIVVVLACWVTMIRKPRGDFMNHLEFGRRFVAGEDLYRGGLDIPYPPSFAFAYAPLSMMPPRIAGSVLFAIGCASLCAILWILNSLTASWLPLASEQLIWVVAATLLVASRFILRDFADGGPHLIYLGLVWGAIYSFRLGKMWRAGLSLGLAIALKCTPALFLLYFAWKRQWKMTGITLLFAGAFGLAQALRENSYDGHLRMWFETVTQGTQQADPSVGILGPEELQNKSLRPALARYLMHLPAGHPGRFDGVGYIDFLDLSARAASVIIKGITLLSLAGIAWLFRRPLAGKDDPALIWECAAVSILALLYSPITHGTHCVAIIPALHLLFRSFAAGRLAQSWVRGVLGCTSVVLLLTNRSLIGLNPSLLLESYHLVTLSLVALLLLVLACERQLSSTTGS